MIFVSRTNENLSVKKGLILKKKNKLIDKNPFAIFYRSLGVNFSLSFINNFILGIP